MLVCVSVRIPHLGKEFRFLEMLRRAECFEKVSYEERCFFFLAMCFEEGYFEEMYGGEVCLEEVSEL